MSLYANRFRPLGTGDIFDEVFDLYKRNFVVLAGISGALYMPLGLIQAFLLPRLIPGLLAPTGIPSDPANIFRSLPMPAIMGVAALVLADFAIVRPFATGALCYSVSQTYLGKPTTIGQAFAFMGRRIWHYIGTWLLAGFVVLGAAVVVTFSIGFLVTISLAAIALQQPVIGVLMTVGVALLALAAYAVLVLLYLFVPPVFVVEDKRYLRALARGRRLLSGWRFLGKALLVIILTWTVIFVIEAALPMLISLAAGLGTTMAGSPGLLAAQSIVGSVAECLLQPIALCAIVLLYYDARIRKEGYDLELLAAEMSAASTGVAASGTVSAEPTHGWGTVLGGDRKSDPEEEGGGL